MMPWPQGGCVSLAGSETHTLPATARPGSGVGQHPTWFHPATHAQTLFHCGHLSAGEEANTETANKGWGSPDHIAEHLDPATPDPYPILPRVLDKISLLAEESPPRVSVSAAKGSLLVQLCPPLYVIGVPVPAWWAGPNQC